MATLWFAVLLVTAPGLLAPGVQPSPPPLRSELILTEWQRAVVPSTTTTLPTTGWQAQALPHSEFLPWTGPGVVQFYRTSMRVPNVANRRFLLDLPPMLYRPRVWVADQLVDQGALGWFSRTIDLTAHVRPGQTVPLTLSVQDRTGTYVEGFRAPEGASSSILRGKILEPVGGYRDQTGVIGTVTLRTVPLHHVDDRRLRIVTETRRDRWTVSGVARPGVSRTVRLGISGLGAPPRTVGEARVAPDGTWTWTGSGKDLRRWSPEDPYLYTLNLTLLDAKGQVLDRTTTRFGFREFWVEGPNYFLNGVRRNLLASSSWPVQEVLDRETIIQRIRGIKRTGAIAFRLHIGPWPDEVLRVADEEGLLIIDESPIYTDGEGIYAYEDPRFWANFRRVLTDMVERGRNHPSVIQWSLGNEILYMGNQRHLPDLPQRLGELAVFTRRLDPTRPVVFEADIDPDGQYDVIGLHYPHEIPAQHAYPINTDWLGTGKQTDAGGGMLGTTGTNFKWDRTKPLYIGEYLWAPQGDYSTGSVFYGERAYYQRRKYHVMSQARAWFDQTVAYRRAGVSGLTPWTAVDFGMAPGDPVLVDAQRRAYVRLGAIPRQRAFRAFAGGELALTYDLFNDTVEAKNLRLSLTLDGGDAVHQTVKVGPGETEPLRFQVPVPQAEAPVVRNLTVTLTDGTQLVNETKTRVETFPRRALPTIHRNGSPITWIRTAKDLTLLKNLDPRAPGLVIVDEHVLDAPTVSPGERVVLGAPAVDAESLIDYVRAGGRALVLEQRDHTALPLSLPKTEHRSTMSFSLTGSVRDPQFWGPSMVIAEQQFVRHGMGGARALTITGGPRALAQSPDLLYPFGQGVFGFTQTRIGPNYELDPAAGDHLVDLLDQLVNAPSPRAGRLLGFAGDAEARELVDATGLNVTWLNRPLATTDLDGLAGILAIGSSEAWRASSDRLAKVRQANVPILYLMANEADFNQMGEPLGLQKLRAVPAASVTHPLSWDDATQSRSEISGISAEELVWTSTPQGWDQQITRRQRTVPAVIVPEEVPLPFLRRTGKQFTGANVQVEGDSLVFDRSATVTAEFPAPTDAWYSITVVGSGKPTDLVELEVGEETVDWLDLSQGRATTWVRLHPRPWSLALSFINGPTWGGGGPLRIDAVEVAGPVQYPNGVTPLVRPGSLVVDARSPGRVVVGTARLTGDPENRIKAMRQISALAGNLGLPFRTDTVAGGTEVGAVRFRVLDGPYNEVSGGRIILRSNGTAVAPVTVRTAGEYEVWVQAGSTMALGQRARLRVTVGQRSLEHTVTSTAPSAQQIGRMRLDAGDTDVRLSFLNDASGPGEDLNVEVGSLSFRLVQP